LKIVLLGANGQVGGSFLRDGRLDRLGKVVPVTRNGLLPDGRSAEAGDLSTPNELIALLDHLKPNIVINAAAYTAVDKAEQEENLATSINGEAVGAVGRWATKHHALVVHYSTDYVFDGTATQPYSPDTPTSPIGAYGRSKLVGERLLVESGARHLLFRTAWVYSSSGHNFLRTMLKLGRERDQLNVVGDQWGSPTSAQLIVDGTLAALSRWMAGDDAIRRSLEGIHHLVASGITTWHGFASAIFDEALRRGVLARKPDVHTIATTDYPTPAKRPAYSVLDNSGFQQRFGFKLPDWGAGVSEVMQQIAQGK